MIIDCSLSALLLSKIIKISGNRLPEPDSKGISNRHFEITDKDEAKLYLKCYPITHGQWNQATSAKVYPDH